MCTASPAYLEVIEFITARTTPEGVVRFHPSPEAQQRATALIEREKEIVHSNAKTTGLYDRRDDDISAGEVERIGI